MYHRPPETERLRPFPGRHVLRTRHGYLSGVQLDQQQPDDVDQEHQIGQHGQAHRARQYPRVKGFVYPTAETGGENRAVSAPTR